METYYAVILHRKELNKMEKAMARWLTSSMP